MDTLVHSVSSYKITNIIPGVHGARDVNISAKFLSIPVYMLSPRDLPYVVHS